MGNQLAQPQRLHREQLAELPNVVYKELLGGGRLLKTVLCVHDIGALVVKVYHSRGEPVDLKPYERQLTEIRDKLMCVPHSHMWPFQVFTQNESTAFLVRPYIYSNLYDRLSTRPFLNTLEKRWVAFQLLYALTQCHDRGVCHGDVKCENVLVTSWNWVLLADFASYKPAYLPADNPADFSYYFDIGSRRRCYVAPERFLDGSNKVSGGVLLPSMDIFSAGCVIAELFLDGKALFDLSQLIMYRKGEHKVENVLSAVDPEVRGLVQHMIQLDPDKRMNADGYLKHFTPSVFPATFESILHPFFGSILPKSSDARVAVLDSQFTELTEKITSMERSTRESPAETAQPAEEESKQQEPFQSYCPPATSGQITERPAYMSDRESGDLLEEVGALLSESQNMETHVSSLVSSGEGFIMDGSSSSSSIRKSNRQYETQLEVEEVMTDEMHQYQYCGADGTFVDVSDSQSSMIPGDDRYHYRHKEDVRLPKGGWRWMGSWEVDLEGPCDNEGWVYKGNTPKYLKAINQALGSLKCPDLQAVRKCQGQPSV